MINISRCHMIIKVGRDLEHRVKEWRVISCAVRLSPWKIIILSQNSVVTLSIKVKVIG